MSTGTTQEAELPADLVERVLQLSPAARAQLRALLDGTPADPELAKAAMRDELQRRWDAVRSGAEPSYGINETMAYLRAQLADGEPK